MDTENQSLVMIEALREQVALLQSQMAARDNSNGSAGSTPSGPEEQGAAMEKLREQLEAVQLQLASGRPSNSASNFRIDATRAPKIPPIARKNLRNWLFQVEATLRRAGITQDATKFDYLVCALDDDAMSRLSHIIQCDPLPSDAFEQAKDSLISAYALSNEENLRKLLKGQIANTNCKPSLILSQIKELNSTCCLPEEVLKSIFFEQLSEHQREILTLLRDKDLKTLAETADKLYSASSNSEQHFAHSVAASRLESLSQVSDTSLAATIGRLETKIDSLVDVLKKAHGGRSQPSVGRSRSRSRSKSRNSSRLCLAHSKYPDNPLNCKEWCAKFGEWLASKSASNNS